MVAVAALSEAAPVETAKLTTTPPTGIPDASDQMMILLLWSLPVTAFLLGLVWIRRGRSRTNGEVTR